MASRGTVGVLLCALLAGIAGCGGKTTNLTPSPHKETLKNMPDWYLEPGIGDDHLFAAATATSKDVQTAMNKAKIRARADLATQMQTRMTNLTKDFQEETGEADDSEYLQYFSSATKAVTDQVLSGSRVEKKHPVIEGDVWRAYVLMSLPIGAANQLLMERIKANEKVYTQFRATKAFAELEQELEEYKKKME